VSARTGVGAALVMAALAVAALAVAGCSSSSKSSIPSTNATASTTASAVAPTVAPPGIPSTVATTNCGGKDALLAAIKGSIGNGSLHLTISEFVVAKTDPTWVRAKIPPPANSGGVLSDGAVVVAHCEAGQWQGVDVGTDGVGCNPPVPPAITKEIGYQCQSATT
jgi:hypothetical protein